MERSNGAHKELGTRIPPEEAATNNPVPRRGPVLARSQFGCVGIHAYYNHTAAGGMASADMVCLHEARFARPREGTCVSRFPERGGTML